MSANIPTGLKAAFIASLLGFLVMSACVLPYLGQMGLSVLTNTSLFHEVEGAAEVARDEDFTVIGGSPFLRAGISYGSGASARVIVLRTNDAGGYYFEYLRQLYSLTGAPPRPVKVPVYVCKLNPEWVTFCREVQLPWHYGALLAWLMADAAFFCCWVAAAVALLLRGRLRRRG